MPALHRSTRGYTLIGLLFLMAVLGLLLAAAGSTWQAAREREKEAELLFIGNQYRQALLDYYQLGAKVYPKKLQDLIADPRFPNTVRHLRRLWPDPVSGGDWVLVRDEAGGIKGVHSVSDQPPRKIAGFTKENASFEGATKYSDWVFETKP
jgi:type II secretory pathway pseudopilin PulG